MSGRGVLVVLGLLVAGGPLAAQEPIPTREMNAINWVDFQKWVPSKIRTVLLPVGTLEAHGVVNNGADNTVPEAMARDLAEKVNAMIAPTIHYGATTSLSAFPGSFRVDPEVFKAYSREVIAGLTKSGFKNIIVINGHGPNFPLLQEACAEVAEKTVEATKTAETLGIGLKHYLVVSAITFAIGMTIIVVRRNAIAVLMGIELLLNSAGLNFVAYSKFIAKDMVSGQIMAVFIIVLAAAEAALALAIILNIYNNTNTVEVDEADALSG